MSRSTEQETENAISAKKLLKTKYDDLGPMSFHEMATACLFGVCVVLWFFRDPQFIPGWAYYISASVYNDLFKSLFTLDVLKPFFF